jgi:hypothetical protein
VTRRGPRIAPHARGGCHLSHCATILCTMRTLIVVPLAYLRAALMTSTASSVPHPTGVRIPSFPGPRPGHLRQPWDPRESAGRPSLMTHIRLADGQPLSDDHEPPGRGALGRRDPNHVDPRWDRTAIFVLPVPGEIVNAGTEDAIGQPTDAATGKVANAGLNETAVACLKVNERPI